jgi:RHS repeat-associated protein
VTYTYPINHIRPYAVSSVGATNYDYDDNGNMHTRGSQTLTWDVENRVTAVTGGASFLYNGDGNRVKKTENGETILYVNKYFEKNLDTEEVTTYYYLGGKLVAQRKGTTLEYLHQDSLNSTSVVSDDDGVLVSSISYLPYGEIRSGSVPTDKLFTGQRLDDAGLYYYGARYYDPTIGRFVSADPTVPETSNPQAFNRYSYVINNPISAVDPSGLDYIFVGGAGSKITDTWWTDMLIKLNWDPAKEKVLFIPDQQCGGFFETGDQADVLKEALATGKYQDIKIIGHSEGALATAKVLDEIAKNKDTRLSNTLTAAFLLDAPTGFIADQLVFGNSDSIYYDLPRRLHSVQGMENVQLLDIWNIASCVHFPHAMPGWSENSISYDSRPFWLQVICSSCPDLIYAYGRGYGLDDFIGTLISYHDDPRTSSFVFDTIQRYVGY